MNIRVISGKNNYLLQFELHLQHPLSTKNTKNTKLLFVLLVLFVENHRVSTNVGVICGQFLNTDTIPVCTDR